MAVDGIERLEPNYLRQKRGEVTPEPLAAVLAVQAVSLGPDDVLLLGLPSSWSADQMVCFRTYLDKLISDRPGLRVLRDRVLLISADMTVTKVTREPDHAHR